MYMKAGMAALAGAAAAYGLGRPVLIQPSDIPRHKAKTIARILNSGGSGTVADWEVMDVWVTAYGLRPVLADIGRIYQANGTDWSTEEQSWWITQLS